MIVVLNLSSAQQTRLVKQLLSHLVHLLYAAGREFSAQFLIAERSGCHDEVSKLSSRGTGRVQLWIMRGTEAVSELVYEGVL